MFGLILISFITLLHLYVFGRISSIPFVRNNLPKKFILGPALFLWLLFLVGRIYGHYGSGVIAKILEFTGMNWMACLFLLFVCILIVDVVTLFGMLLPAKAPSMRGVAAAVGLTLSAVALVQGMRAPVIAKYEVEMPGLAEELDGTVIVAMSDLHIGSLLGKRWLKARIDQAQAEQPDLIVFVGDMFEGHGPAGEELLPMLKRLSAPLGVFAVNGNHEHYGHNSSNELLENAGVRVLSNQWTTISGGGLILAGVDDLSIMRYTGRGADTVLKTVQGIPPAAATILLSHTPWQYEEAAQAGVDLMLSGHTHGGQIWPFGYLVKWVHPLFVGRYEVDTMTAIVCRGTGTWGPRMRLWQPGEILRVVLKVKR